MAINVIFHCSDSGFGNAALIAKWHSLPPKLVVQNGKKYQGRGWSGIGYHYVILNGWLARNVYNPIFDGHIETGRPLNNDPVVSGDEMGAHVRGHNRNSVGVCLIGRSGQFTDEQLNSALKVANILEEQFGEITILQHSDLDRNKPKCAGLDLEQFKNNYRIFKEISS
jgi:hypothetical protein